MRNLKRKKKKSTVIEFNCKLCNILRLFLLKQSACGYRKSHYINDSAAGAIPPLNLLVPLGVEINPRLYRGKENERSYNKMGEA